MDILGIKEGHDGTYCLIENGKLKFSLEAEKDSFPRCTDTTADLLIRASANCNHFPDIIAVGGWTKGLFSSEPRTFAGYFGLADSTIQIGEKKLFGKNTTIFSSTHERSHIWSAYGMSPFPQGQPCYILIWEGNVGNFYYIDEELKLTNLGCAMEDPGNKYTFLFSLADKKSPDMVGFYDISHPGKMMALAAYGQVNSKLRAEEKKLIDSILTTPQFDLMMKLSKSDFSWSRYYNIGVETQEFKDLARYATDRIYEEFYRFAVDNLKPGFPLLIAGGCGLNCEWNSKWRESGLFTDVFVPPCTNDSGSAIGTAVDAMQFFTGKAKIDWSVYCGELFNWDSDPTYSKYKRVNWSMETLASKIANGSIVAWVEGRYEMGPRALGHRSLIAEPKNAITTDRLNRIKKRDNYRPIAPLCLESALESNFSPNYLSPHMLYFYKVKNEQLKAVTHVDHSARVQTLDPSESPILASLLTKLDDKLGYAVICNTSLNYSGRGFINRMSDLIDYCTINEIDGFMVDGELFWLQQ